MQMWIYCIFNLLSPGEFERNFIEVIFQLISVIGDWGVYFEIVLMWLPLAIWRHQAITGTNDDLSSVRSSGIHLSATLGEIPQPSVTEISWKITYIKFCSKLPGADELTTMQGPSTITMPPLRLLLWHRRAAEVSQTPRSPWRRVNSPPSRAQFIGWSSGTHCRTTGSTTSLYPTSKYTNEISTTNNNTAIIIHTNGTITMKFWRQHGMTWLNHYTGSWYIWAINFEVTLNQIEERFPSSLILSMSQGPSCCSSCQRGGRGSMGARASITRARINETAAGRHPDPTTPRKLNRTSLSP